MRPVVLLGLWLGYPAHAQDIPGPEAPGEQQEVPEIGPQDEDWRSSTSVGMAYFGASSPSHQLNSTDNVGLAIESRSGRAVGGGWRVNVGYGVGLTEFDRTRNLWDKADRTGRWTTQAYKDVYGWAESKGDADETAPLRWMASFFAFSGLTLGYALAGVMYVGGPVASTTFMNLDVTASQHFGADGAGPYVAGGLGLIGFSHPLSPDLRGGVGPVLAAGMDVGKMTVGTRLLFSPPSWHGEGGIEGSRIVAATATVGMLR